MREIVGVGGCWGVEREAGKGAILIIGKKPELHRTENWSK